MDICGGVVVWESIRMEMSNGYYCSSRVLVYCKERSGISSIGSDA